jgi:AcrR family transcriptional regulator
MRARRIDPQLKVDTVLNEARRLFVEHGYHRVSIPMLVAASRVSTGAIYHHFGNKEELARTIYEQTLGEFQERLEERLVGQTDVVSQLRAFGRLIIDIAESDPEMMRYMLFLNHGEFLSACPPICSSAPFRWVQERVRQGMAAGVFRGTIPLVASAAFTGVLLRSIELCYQGIIDSPPSAIADAILDHALWAVLA